MSLRDQVCGGTGGPAFDLVGVLNKKGVPDPFDSAQGRLFAQFAKGGNQERLRQRSVKRLAEKAIRGLACC